MNAALLGLALVVAAPGLKTPKDETPPIIGLWMLTEYTESGQPVGFDVGTSTEFLPEGKRIWRDGVGAAADERGYKLIAKTTPPALDLIRPNGNPQAPDVFPCLYKVDGDTLVVTIGEQSGDRPTKHGEGWRVMKYKRAKKE